MSEITLPHDHEVEQAVLASLLLRPDAIRRCDVPISAFYSETHRAIYGAMLEAEADDEPLDPVLIANRIRISRGNDAKQEVSRVLDAVIERNGKAARFDHYLATLKRIAYHRELVKLEVAIRQMAEAERLEPEEIEQRRDAMIGMVRDHYWPSDRATDPLAAEEELRAFYQRAEDWAVQTGYAELDRVVGDVYPGMVVTLLARPGIGKSILALNLVARWLDKPAEWGVLFASLEMGSTLATDRLIRICEGWTIAESKHAMRSGAVPTEYRRRTRDRYCLYSRARASLAQIEAAADAWEREHGRKIRVLALDYFQYLRAERGESLYEKGSRLSRELKELAKNRDLVVWNLSQVKRGEEGGKGHDCPTLEAARDSGTIEENADVVLGMWTTKDKPRVLMVRGLKVRQGERGHTAELDYYPETGRIA